MQLSCKEVILKINLNLNQGVLLVKLLTITVPCYNSQDYMENCVNSLLPGGEDVEILIVDDGSKDDTAAIADRLAAAHPGIVLGKSLSFGRISRFFGPFDKRGVRKIRAR